MTEPAATAAMTQRTCRSRRSSCRNRGAILLLSCCSATCTSARQQQQTHCAPHSGSARPSFIGCVTPLRADGGGSDGELTQSFNDRRRTSSRRKQLARPVSSLHRQKHQLLVCRLDLGGGGGGFRSRIWSRLRGGQHQQHQAPLPPPHATAAEEELHHWAQQKLLQKEQQAAALHDGAEHSADTALIGTASNDDDDGGFIKREPMPEKRSSILSRLLFLWASPLMARGNARILQEEDVWTFPPERQVATTSVAFERVLDGELEQAAKRRQAQTTAGVAAVQGKLVPALAQAPLLRSLWTCFWREFMTIGFVRLLNTLIQFIPALLVRRLLRSIEVSVRPKKLYLCI